MSSRRLWLALAALVPVVAGCGSSASTRSPMLRALPLVKGAKIVHQSRQCDRGANAYCAIELVVVGRRFSSAGALVYGERHRLFVDGWSLERGDTGAEHAAESPSHALRVVYATAEQDLEDVDLGYIQRPRTITLSLAQTMFDRLPAMSLTLEAGPS